LFLLLDGGKYKPGKNIGYGACSDRAGDFPDSSLYLNVGAHPCGNQNRQAERSFRHQISCVCAGINNHPLSCLKGAVMKEAEMILSLLTQEQRRKSMYGKVFVILADITGRKITPKQREQHE
jgi:hypothetical protein